MRLCSSFKRYSSQFLLRFVRGTRMYSQSGTRFQGYDEAIKALSSLDKRPALSNCPLPNSKSCPSDKLHLMRKLMEISEVSQADIDALNVIHVAGTKGKGSTCALVESLIREGSSSGVKTGFYSSPHLVSTTERIRINGSPISQEKFAEHFWCLYHKIEVQMDLILGILSNIYLQQVPDRILFFKFLTLMALHVFIKEKVDVVILEVGIGGTYDCTNVIERPLACAITHLGLDHTTILGPTIQDIAWHKSGICKPGVPVFVDSHQPPEALAVIRQRALEIGSPCYVAPEFGDYDWGGKPPVMGLEGKVQIHNAALALQLAQCYLAKSSESFAFTPGVPFAPTEGQRKGLRSVSWPGRFQTLVLNPNLTLYLDAAHTKESMEECVAWYASKSSPKAQRVLLFNATKDHDSSTMIKNLKSKLVFDAIVFCTNVIAPSNEILDNTYPPDVFQKMRERCLCHRDHWLSLRGAGTEEVQVIPYIAHALLWIMGCGNKELFHEKYVPQDILTEGSSSSKSLLPLQKTKDHMEILVTGSLHLVGDVMETLGIEPS